MAWAENPKSTLLSAWVDHSLDFGTPSDPFSSKFLTDENILEAMMSEGEPWEDYHHHSHPPDYEEKNLSELYHPSIKTFFSNSFLINAIESERNLSNIEEIISINILTKPGIVENIHVGVSCSPSKLDSYRSLFREFRDVFAWSYEEMPGIDTSIVEHTINMYPDVKPVHQRLHHVHPKKAATIKAEVEKILRAGFIYPIPLTELVSNIVPVMKKQGTIRVCVDYQDVNQACPKDNYPTPFIDQIIDDCARCEIFSFMDGFSGYNQINILLDDQHKTTFICPGAHSHIRNSRLV